MVVVVMMIMMGDMVVGVDDVDVLLLRNVRRGGSLSQRQW